MYYDQVCNLMAYTKTTATIQYLKYTSVIPFYRNSKSLHKITIFPSWFL